MKRVLLFCILMICLVPTVYAASYDSGTDIATATSADSLEDIYDAVGDENLFAKNGVQNYTMNISEITITSGSFIMDSDILFFDCKTDNDTHFDIGGNGLIIRNNSIITSINSSARGSFWSRYCPSVFTVTDSTLDGIYKIDFNDYGSGETLYFDNSTLRNIYNIDSFEGIDAHWCDISDWGFYGIQRYGNLTNNYIHDNIGYQESSTAFQYPIIDDCVLVKNNTFESLTRTGVVLSLKERTTYMEVVDNKFYNCSNTGGELSRAINAHVSTAYYTDPEPIWIHNNTHDNVSVGFFAFGHPYFKYENNTINNSDYGFATTSQVDSNGTSLWQNNIIINTEEGIYIDDDVLTGVNFVNNSYLNVPIPYRVQDQNINNLLFENETYTDSGFSYFDAGEMKLTNPILPFKFGAIATGGTLNHYNGFVNLSAHAHMRFIRNAYTAAKDDLTWTDIKQDGAGTDINYTVQDLYANYEYKVYKDGALIDTIDSGTSGEIEFYSAVATTPGNVFVINTTLLSGMRYNSATPFINTIDESGTVTGYSRTLNPDTDSSSNLRVVTQ